ncbi:unnamed protein product [Blepharisma stoltei]|uniref:PA domain-containing protein n=1 Tax=Blepharisma stoltei TaxID=1481888 RepID=A0AAU9KCK4_9CILI|nr:unnamed protein product [Blepharisma stoltei]
MWVLNFILASIAFANIYVFSPDKLRMDMSTRHSHGPIPSSLANFGNPPYGSIIVGRVFLPRNENQYKGCSPLDHISWDDDPDIVNSPILLLERGGCSFVVKVRNAQNIGASAVLIMNNVDGSIDPITMIDDGTAGNIDIPSLLITKADGDLIKDYIKKESFQTRVALSISFEMPHPDNTVEYDIWMTSGFPIMRKFLYEFAPVAKKFNSTNAVFTPHYVIYYCVECKATGFKTDNQDCYGGGKYCSPDPDEGYGPLTGRDVLDESLRQLCINKANIKNQKVWWDYIRGFYEMCGSDKNFTKKCSEKAMERVKIDKYSIEECVASSFSISNWVYSDNSLLDDEKYALADSGILFYPAIVINNQVYRGDFEVSAVMTAICAGYQDKPKICIDYFNGLLPGDDSETSEGVGAGTVVLVMALCLLFLIAVLIAYWVWMRRDMKADIRRQANSAINQYIALTEQNIRNH